MIRWFKKREEVDPRPTAFDFPVRIWSEEEILPEYAPFLIPLIRAGLELQKILYVPKPRYEEDAKEYMLTYLPDGILYLERQADGTILESRITREQTEGICMTEDLLRGCISVYWKQGRQRQNTAIRYNRVRRELFYPFLNRLLGREEDFDVKNASRHLDLPEQMKREQLVLYRYGTEACRLGDRAEDWKWWSTGTPGWFRKRKTKASACALCRAGGGQVLVDILGNRVDIWYLPDRKTAVTIEGEKKDRLMIRIGDRNTSPVKEIRLRKES